MAKGDGEADKPSVPILSSRMSRRKALSNVGKAAIGVVAVVVVGGIAYYEYSSGQVAPASSSAISGPIIIGVAEDAHGTNGPGIFKAVQLAINEINAAGGVKLNGKQVQLAMAQEDTKEEQTSFVASDVVDAVTKLIVNDKANVILGGWTGSGYIPDVVAQYKVVYISGSGGSIDSTKISSTNKYKYVFQDQIDVTGWGNEEANALLYYAQKYKATKVAWVTEDQSFFHTHLDIAKALLSQNGVTIDPIIWFPPTQTDFSSILQQVRSSGVPVTFPGFVVANSTPFMQEWKDTQLKTFLVGVDIPGGLPGVGEKTHGLYDYLVDLEGLARAPITDMTIPFYDAYTKSAGRNPDIYDGNYYTATYLYKGAVEKAQSLDADTLVSVIHDNKWTSVFGPIAFNNNNYVSPANPITDGFVLLFSQWQSQQLKVVWPTKFSEAATLYPPWHPPPQ